MTPQEKLDIANAQYEYETSHKDAADAYETIFIENGIDMYATDTDMVIEFAYYPCFEDLPETQSVFLGNGEIEVQLPEPITEADIEIFNMSDFYAKVGSDLVYCPYPTNLCVICYDASEDDSE